MTSSFLDARPVAVLLAVLLQSGLLVGVEIGFRRGLGPEVTRQIAHIAGAASVAVLPLFLRLSEIVVIAVFFTGVLVWTRARHLLGAVHGVNRVTVGALVFPAGLLLAVVLGWEHRAAIAYAALVLAIADPAAAIVGSRFRSVGWRVIGGRKTLAGSLTFAAVAIAIGLAIGAGAGEVRLIAAVGAGLLLALVEGSLGYGLDNIPVPALASVLGTSVLGL